VRPVHSVKAKSPILVTDGGIEREVRPRHLRSALDPIVVSDSGRVRLVNLVHPSNTEPLRMVRFFGSDSEVKCTQFLNAQRSILVMESARETEVRLAAS